MEWVRPRYPDDVQAALDHVAEQGWTIEGYQAVLAIALHHLELEPPRPEPLVQFAEEAFTFKEWSTQRVDAGEIFMACPLCGPATWSVVTDGSEYDTFDAAELKRNDAGEFTSSADFFLCGSCGQRFSVPLWLWEAGWFTWEAVEWGELVRDQPAEVGE